MLFAGIIFAAGWFGSIEVKGRLALPAIWATSKCRGRIFALRNGVSVLALDFQQKDKDTEEGPWIRNLRGRKEVKSLSLILQLSDRP